MSKRIRLSGIMLVQNNAATLGPVLDQLCRVADEVVVVDGGSDDETAAIIRARPNVRAYQHAFDGNFARQRNYALDRARGAWVLSLDSDELLGPRAERWIPTLIRVPFVNWYSFPRYWLVEDAGRLKYLCKKPYYRERQVRLFRNRPPFRYLAEGTGLHERLPEAGRGFGRPLRSMHIFHYDFLLNDRAAREAKVARYRALDPSQEHVHIRYLWEDSGIPLADLAEPLPGDLRSGGQGPGASG